MKPTAEHCYCQHSTVGASILNCNFINIKQELADLLSAGLDFIHLDVMDGNFVEDITFGPSFVTNLIKEFPNVKFEVHMMVEHPMRFIEPMAKAGVQRYIFHYEVTKDNGKESKPSVEDLSKTIRSNGMEPSLAINPETPVEAVMSYVGSLINCVVIMTVKPGRGGQKFMADMMPKVKFLREKHENLCIELDGGIGPSNIDICGENGANRIITGTALLRSTQKSKDVQIMRDALYPRST